jgi:hypothetical protein
MKCCGNCLAWQRIGTSDLGSCIAHPPPTNGFTKMLISSFCLEHKPVEVVKKEVKDSMIKEDASSKSRPRLFGNTRK